MSDTPAPEPEFPEELIERCMKSQPAGGMFSDGIYREIIRRDVIAILRAAKEWDAQEGGQDAEIERLRSVADKLLSYPASPQMTTEELKEAWATCRIHARAALTQSTAKGEGE